MFFQLGCSMNPTPSGPAMLNSSPAFNVGHAAGAAAFDLVEEFDVTGGLVDAVDAHRPAHPHFGAIGRRAEQMKHLPGVSPQSTLVHLQTMDLYSLFTQSLDTTIPMNSPTRRCG